ncbi:TetR/AcrR family transcriptional regulator [Microbacterium sp. No. 7]|uniref:TetR/AcrR family transcriptional regulator n=1 Tax=Microbacterium sp. No. 7 TaxID=1714373 RepID=UPI0006D2404B|nr:TetR/AcrR family transcriptional regulator [Microbacterium sp. No. 7]
MVGSASPSGAERSGAGGSGAGGSTRTDRRRAATRARILVAADRLFAERGYEATSVEGIADAADVAVRTIYLHFPSKAAMLLAYFDDWLDAFVAAIVARPVDEPIDRTVEAALGVMAREGWTDRRYDEMPAPYPTVEFLGGGPPEIAGHILHSWVRAQDVIAADARERGGHGVDSLVPRARAAAVFAAWVATLLVAGESAREGRQPPEASGHELGAALLAVIARGATPPPAP